jgi:hypothetical protein
MKNLGNAARRGGERLGPNEISQGIRGVAVLCHAMPFVKDSWPFVKDPRPFVKDPRADAVSIYHDPPRI